MIQNYHFYDHQSRTEIQPPLSAARSTWGPPIVVAHICEQHYEGTVMLSQSAEVQTSRFEPVVIDPVKVPEVSVHPELLVIDPVEVPEVSVCPFPQNPQLGEPETVANVLHVQTDVCSFSVPNEVDDQNSREMPAPNASIPVRVLDNFESDMADFMRPSRHSQ